jgi:putative transposase
MKIKGKKVQLELNNEQKTLASKHAGTARHAYNWGVQVCKELSKKREKLPSGFALGKKHVAEVKSENKWYYEVSKCAPQKAIHDFRDAWDKYFKELKNGTIEKKKNNYISKQKRKGSPVNYDVLNDIGKPKFKKKGINDSFYLEGGRVGTIKIKKNKIFLPHFGWVKMSELFKEDFTIKNVVISRTANEWFISWKQELPNLKIEGIELKPIVGADLGIKTLATLSDGTTFKNVKAFKKYKKRLKRAQQKQSKRYNPKVKIQSNNYKKASKKVAKIHQKIANIRKDSTHKLTTYLAKNHSEVKIEDLNVSGMMKNRKLSGAIQDGGFYEFRRQLTYKCEWYGSKLVVIDRFFASSKTCSCCGKIKKDLKLSDRIFNCDSCGLSICRDLNASINIKNYTVSYTEKACEELEKPTKNRGNSLKQEANSDQRHIVEERGSFV